MSGEKSEARASRAVRDVARWQLTIRGVIKMNDACRCKGSKSRVCLLVLLGFLLDITDFLRNLLQGVFESAILQLEIWKCQKRD